MKIVINDNSIYSVINFRNILIKKLIEEGHEITIITPDAFQHPFFDNLNVCILKLYYHRTSTSILKNLSLKKLFFRTFKNLKPDLVINFTIKCNMYGSVAARKVGAKVICNITGLGSGVLAGGFIHMVIKRLYRKMIKSSDLILAQNEEIVEYLEQNYKTLNKVKQINGSGIDLEKFTGKEYPGINNENKNHFIYIGRFIRDKGFFTFYEAAKLLSKENIQMSALGSIADNPGSATKDQIENIKKESILTILDRVDDIREHLVNYSCLVLPSHTEGISNVLLESGATGLNLISTDISGCREVNIINDLQIKVDDVEDLVKKIKYISQLPIDKRNELQTVIKDNIVANFDRKKVTEVYFHFINSMEN